MITYNKGLPSLPDDIIYGIFGLLDIEALQSCSLTDKALSCSAKPFIHRELYLSPRSETPARLDTWKEGLPILGERGLLQHTYYISILLPLSISLSAHDLQPHIQHLRSLTNLRSLKIHHLDIPSFIPKVEEYFAAFIETLQSLELVSPLGCHKEIAYFICQFPKLRDLRIQGFRGHIGSVYNDDSHPDIKTSPPLDGTLVVKLGEEMGTGWGDSKGAQLVLSSLVTLPSCLKFRTLMLSGCRDDEPQLLVDACARTLECMEFTGHYLGALFLYRRDCPKLIGTYLSGNPLCPRLSFARHPAFRKFKTRLVSRGGAEDPTRWLSETLSTITSTVFAELTIYFPSVYTVSENRARGWNSVDDVLDRLNSRGAVTLVVRPAWWVVGDKSEDLIGKCFPLMWKNGRVVLEVPSPGT